MLEWEGGGESSHCHVGGKKKMIKNVCMMEGVGLKKIKVIYGIITGIIVNYCNCNCGPHPPTPPPLVTKSPIRIVGEFRFYFIISANHCRTGRMRDVIAMALVLCLLLLLLLLLLLMSLIQFSPYVFYLMYIPPRVYGD